MERYKFIDDLTSDVLFIAYGKDLKQLYENTALAVASIICTIDKIKQTDSIELEVKGDSLENTMWNFLSEMIVEFEVNNMFFSKFEIIEASENHVKAKLHGEPMKPELGETVVKSLTNYKYKVEKTKEGYQASICLDI